MKTTSLLYLLVITLLLAIVSSASAQTPSSPLAGILPTPEGTPAIKPELDVLRPVTPDDREDVDLLYWHFAKQMNHGAMIFLSRSPVSLMTVEFGVFPIWARRQESGLISIKIVQPDNRADPKSFWDVKESMRIIPKPLVDRLEKVWDAALVTARVDSKQGLFMTDGTRYEFRGGTGTDHYVVQAHSPSSGVPLALVHLTTVLISYCGADGSAPTSDTKYIEETLKYLEVELKANSAKPIDSKKSEGK